MGGGWANARRNSVWIFQCQWIDLVNCTLVMCVWFFLSEQYLPGDDCGVPVEEEWTEQGWSGLWTWDPEV